MIDVSTFPVLEFWLTMLFLILMTIELLWMTLFRSPALVELGTLLLLLPFCAGTHLKIDQDKQGQNLGQ